MYNTTINIFNINLIFNRFKIIYLVAFFTLFIGIGSAYAVDLTFSVDTTLVVNSRNYVIQAGSTATSFTVATTTLTVVVPSSSTFTLISTNRDKLTNDLAITQLCNSVNNSVTVNGPKTVIFTPSATPCSTIVIGGSALTTGTTPTRTPPTTPSSNTTSSSNVTTTPPLVTANIPGCNNGTVGFSTFTGQSCIGNLAVSGNNTGLPTYYDFGLTTLKNGSRGEAVKELQRFLNRFLNLGLVVDGKFGPKTILVIKKWQKEHGIIPDGLVGPKTKARMNIIN